MLYFDLLPEELNSLILVKLENINSIGNIFNNNSFKYASISLLKILEYQKINELINANYDYQLLYKKLLKYKHVFKIINEYIAGNITNAVNILSGYSDNSPLIKDLIYNISPLLLKTKKTSPYILIIVHDGNTNFIKILCNILSIQIKINPEINCNGYITKTNRYYFNTAISNICTINSIPKNILFKNDIHYDIKGKGLILSTMYNIIIPDNIGLRKIILPPYNNYQIDNLDVNDYVDEINSLIVKEFVCRKFNVMYDYNY